MEALASARGSGSALGQPPGVVQACFWRAACLMEGQPSTSRCVPGSNRFFFRRSCLKVPCEHARLRLLLRCNFRLNCEFGAEAPFQKLFECCTALLRGFPAETFASRISSLNSSTGHCSGCAYTFFMGAAAASHAVVTARTASLDAGHLTPGLAMSTPGPRALNHEHSASTAILK